MNLSDYPTDYLCLDCGARNRLSYLKCEVCHTPNPYYKRENIDFEKGALPKRTPLSEIEKRFDFSRALELLKAGKKVKRKHWGGYWFFAKDPKATQENPDGYNTSFQFKNGLIVAVLKDNGGVAPASAYQEDLLAVDWMVAE